MTDTTFTPEEIEKTRAIMQMLYLKIKKIDCINAENHESIAYRIAEIMGASKNLYTDMLPKIIDSEGDEDSWEQLVEMRMHFLHLSDLLAEFEELFLSSIEAKEEDD